MGIEQIKETVHLRIEQADERLLRVMHAMTEAYAAPSEALISDEMIMAIPLSPTWKPMTKAELRNEIEEADAEFERGKYISVEDLEKEMEQW